MFELRDYQKESVDASLKYLKGRSMKPGLVVAPTGCHAKGTRIPLATGGFKNVEDIRVGDKLIGDDGTNRTVLKLHKGYGKLYKITPAKGEPFIVNGGHILSLYRTRQGNTGYPSEQEGYDEISVEDYICKTKWYKHIHKLYKPEIVEFEKECIQTIEPYLIGLFLGDGSLSAGFDEDGNRRSGTLSITTRWKEVVEYIYSVARKYNTEIRMAEKNGGKNKAKSYFFRNDGTYLREGWFRRNRLLNEIRRYGLGGKVAGDKFIPDDYLYSSIDNRYDLLAGLIDTDSNYDERRCGYEYSTKSPVMAKQVEFLCRSLGLYAKIGKPKIVKGLTYYRMQITGEISKIPNKVKVRKGDDRKQKKDHRVTGFSVDYVGEGEYFGFELDGNHLYCDEQLFVHHNSGKSMIIGSIVKELNSPTLVLQPSKEILEQNVDKARSFGLNPTIYSASCGVKELSGLTYATLKSIKKDVGNLKKYGIRMILTDECHAGYSPEPESEFMKFITQFSDIKVLGLTATPCRLRSYGSLADGNYSKLNILTKDDTVYFENIVHVTQIRELVEKNFWTPLVYERWIFDEQDLKLTTTGSEYTNESIKEAVKRNGLNNSIYMRIMQLLNEREHILVCMDSVESCNIISTFMNKRMGEITGVVTSETPMKKRTDIINRFKKGELKVVFNYSSLATGFDFPELDCVIFGRPTFSYAVYYQLLGRCVRISPKKKNALIVDCCDNYRRFGRVEDMSIEKFPGYGWCMFAGDKLISGIRMGMHMTKQMMMERLERLKEKRSGNLGAEIMWFGKYEGIRFDKIPPSYFDFIVNNMDMSQNYRFRKILEYYSTIRID